jgi:hypothetical protein
VKNGDKIPLSQKVLQSSQSEQSARIPKHNQLTSMADPSSQGVAEKLHE